MSLNKIFALLVVILAASSSYRLHAVDDLVIDERLIDGQEDYSRYGEIHVRHSVVVDGVSAEMRATKRVTLGVGTKVQIGGRLVIVSNKGDNKGTTKGTHIFIFLCPIAPSLNTCANPDRLASLQAKQVAII